MVAVVHAALNNDLIGARKARNQVDTLARIVYNFGEPSSDAHQRIKCARWLMGRFPSMTMRRPLRQLPAEIDKIRNDEVCQMVDGQIPNCADHCVNR